MIEVLFFAGIRERAGQDTWMLAAKELRVNELKQKLEEAFPDMRRQLSNAMFAVNEEYADDETIVRTGDTVAIIPPVSGG